MASEEALNAHSMVTAPPRKSDTISQSTIALEITARGKKKASTATPEDDLTDVSEAEFTSSGRMQSQVASCDPRVFSFVVPSKTVALLEHVA